MRVYQRNHHRLMRSRHHAAKMPEDRHQAPTPESLPPILHSHISNPTSRPRLLHPPSTHCLVRHHTTLKPTSSPCARQTTAQGKHEHVTRLATLVTRCHMLYDLANEKAPLYDLANEKADAKVGGEKDMTLVPCRVESSNKIPIACLLLTS
jgi:hypothetical protein